MVFSVIIAVYVYVYKIWLSVGVYSSCAYVSDRVAPGLSNSLAGHAKNLALTRRYSFSAISLVEVCGANSSSSRVWTKKV